MSREFMFMSFTDEWTIAMKSGGAVTTWVVAYISATVLTLATSRDLTPQLDAVYIEGKQTFTSCMQYEIPHYQVLWTWFMGPSPVMF